MPFEERIPLIKKIESLRNSRVICFLTSLRPNVSALIAADAVRVFFDHLADFSPRPIGRLDLFLCSNGGDGTVPWRLVALFREFSKAFNVLIPFRAYSAASLLALGADEIVMHPFAEMGPIDPTVSNEFNPMEQLTGRRLGISVEDVAAYVHFIKTTVGITHEDELVRAIEILAKNVHPLALGNVERFLSQSRMIARKILKTHMKDQDEHQLKEIVEKLSSKLHFHGHPINREEARTDIGLKVAKDVPTELETAMWDLYLDYEKEFENQAAFNPMGDLAVAPPPAGGLPQKEYDLLYAMIETTKLSSRFTSKRRYTSLPGMQPGQAAAKEEVLSQGWTHSQAALPANQGQQ